MSSLSSSFRPSVEQLESREVPSVTTFVTHLYQDVLGRQPDAGGYAFWVNRLNLGMDTQAGASTAFMTCPEYRTNVIRSFYLNILGRNSSTSEVNSTLNLFQQGWSQDDIRGLFFGSQEFYNRFGQNPAAFVTQMYTQILHRPSATSNEVSYWVNVLNSSNGDIYMVARYFLNCKEYEQGEVITAYNVFLRRTPDLSGFNFWVGQRQNGVTIETVAVGFLASPEYFWRA